MSSIAVLVAAIQKNHRNFTTNLMDHIFEQVIRGMEENDFKDSQRRVSTMKFISECYNFKVIHTDSLFNLLYSLLNWDVDNSCEIQRLADLDSNSDCFRIRLVCTLLDSLGRYFMRGRRRLLLDRFFVFF
jgi:regulator of nonsense transcripts 2